MLEQSNVLKGKILKDIGNLVPLEKQKKFKHFNRTRQIN